jgi:hypothetical protein
MQAVLETEVVPQSFPLNVPQRKRRTRRTAKLNPLVLSDEYFFTHKLWGTGRVLLKPDFSQSGHPCAVVTFSGVVRSVRLDSPAWLEEEQERLAFFETNRPKTHEQIKVSNRMRGGEEQWDEPKANRQLRKQMKAAGVGGDCDLGLLFSISPILVYAMTGKRSWKYQIDRDQLSISGLEAGQPGDPILRRTAPELHKSYKFWKERHGQETSNVARANIINARRLRTLDTWAARASLNRQALIELCPWYRKGATVLVPRGGTSAAKKGSKVVRLWNGDRVILEIARPIVVIGSWTPGRALSRALWRDTAVSLSAPVNRSRDSWSGWTNDPNSGDDAKPAYMEERQYLESATLVEPAEHEARNLTGAYINRKYRDALKIVKYLPPACKPSGEPYSDSEIAKLTGINARRVRSQRYKIRELLLNNSDLGFGEQVQ